MGERIGRYTLDERVARGGMAEVWRAHADDGTVLCVKRLDPSLKNDTDFIEMFRDEASLCLDFDHENIARMSELIDDGHELAMVMELVDGPSLAKVRSVVEKMNGFGVDEALWIAIQLCRALHHAHTRTRHGEPLNIVHRDVSPQNVLLSKDGKVKLVDFGIAKAAQRLTRTRTGALKGKCSYMAPEQVRGEGLDHRADQFATGIILWEMLTGRRLFGGRNEVLILEQVARSDPVRPSTVKRGIPKSVDRVVLRALGWAPEERFADMKELEKALQACLDAIVAEEAPAGMAVRNVEVDLVPLVEKTLRAAALEGTSSEGGAQRTRVLANASTEEGSAERSLSGFDLSSVRSLDRTLDGPVAMTDPLALPESTGQFFEKRKRPPTWIAAVASFAAVLVLASVIGAVWLAEHDDKPKDAPVVVAPLFTSLDEARAKRADLLARIDGCADPCVADVKQSELDGMWRAMRFDACLVQCRVPGAGQMPAPAMGALEATLHGIGGHPCRTELLDDLLDVKQLSPLGRAALWDSAQGCIWDVKRKDELRAKVKLDAPAWPKKKKRTEFVVHARVKELTLRGTQALSIGEYEAAKALLVEAVDLEPEHVELHAKIGAAFRGLGDAVGAAHHYRMYFHAFPDDKDRERLTLYMKRYQQRTEFEPSTNPSPEERWVRARRMLDDAARKPAAEAITLVESARVLLPTEPDVLERLGEAYAAAGRKDDARVAFEDAMKQRPSRKLRERIKQL